MRIGIDCRLAGMANGGIGRYVSQLVIELVKQAPNETWVLVFHNTQQTAELWQTLPKNVELHYCPVRHYSLMEQIKMPPVWRKLRVDLLHVPHFNIPVLYSGKLILTIHDLLWHHQTGMNVTTLPKWQYHMKYLGYKWLTAQAVKKAAQILVPTQTIAQTVQEFFPFAQNKTVVAYEGVDALFRQARAQRKTKVLKDWQLPTDRKFLLYVGSLYPHKNVELVVQALAKMAEFNLIIIGTRNVFRQRFEKFVAQRKMLKRVHFLGQVSDEQLIDIMAISETLVQPSFSEGFGLTGVEAIVAGSSVIASDIPVFREVYFSGVEFFDPKSVTSFVAAAQRAKAPTAQTQKQYQDRYSWPKMAKQTLDVYRSIK